MRHVGCVCVQHEGSLPTLLSKLSGLFGGPQAGNSLLTHFSSLSRLSTPNASVEPPFKNNSANNNNSGGAAGQDAARSGKASSAAEPRVAAPRTPGDPARPLGDPSQPSSSSGVPAASGHQQLDGAMNPVWRTFSDMMQVCHCHLGRSHWHCLGRSLALGPQEQTFEQVVMCQAV